MNPRSNFRLFSVRQTKKQLHCYLYLNFLRFVKIQL